jgi:glycosyltransferase involved in cell wall biosynthesis
VAEAPFLTLVMPAYNEEATIRGVVVGWDDALGALGVPYELRIYDDGSRDATGGLLEEVARERSRVVAVRQANSGHGPTILRGYREARGEWVFQVDSDDEMRPDAFPALWARRDDADVVLGYRTGRDAPLGRRIITAIAGFTVRLMFGRRVRDVNTPFRLYRRSVLTRLLARVPADAFAPNVILTGLALRTGLRVVEVPVPHYNRRAGTSSIVRLRLWRAAARSFAQTIGVALRARR